MLESTVKPQKRYAPPFFRFAGLTPNSMALRRPPSPRRPLLVAPNTAHHHRRWEYACAEYYCGEEDVGSTSTILLAHGGISNVYCDVSRMVYIADDTRSMTMSNGTMLGLPPEETHIEPNLDKWAAENRLSELFDSLASTILKYGACRHCIRVEYVRGQGVAPPTPTSYDPRGLLHWTPAGVPRPEGQRIRWGLCSCGGGVKYDGSIDTPPAAA